MEAYGGKGAGVHQRHHHWSGERKNVQYDPANNLGLVRLDDGGRNARLLWGFTDGGKFTSEFPAHMMSHAARLAVNPGNRVVMHCHPANLLAMTYVHDLDERTFTRTLWQMCTECIVVFPEGVNVLPWMLCGTNEIGEATAEKMETARLVVWAQHGIYGAGIDLDETFGLIETAEKAAEIYMKIAHLPLKNTISDGQMWQLAGHFGVTPREGFWKKQRWRQVSGEPGNRGACGGQMETLQRHQNPSGAVPGFPLCGRDWPHP